MTVKGAVYIPSRAYNAYQMWKDYDPVVTERDLSYAASLRINALRVWLSYEYWLEKPNQHAESFLDMASTASSFGIRLLPVLFEGCGVAPTEETLNDKSPLTAVCVHSPNRAIFGNPDRYCETSEFVKWFMDAFANDTRLLAIEIMNEPPDTERIQFAREMLKKAILYRGSVPLTMGCANLEDHMYYMDLGVDILQNHLNFPQSKENIEQRLQKMKQTEQILGKPCWMTEWQRIRSGPRGPGGAMPMEGEWQPAYVEYANLLEEYGVSGFVWSLMLKPAYLPGQRKKCVLNGLFHEDGAVWSLEDARAVSGNAEFTAVERRAWPQWAHEIPLVYGKLSV